jgi:hypothetical protein
MFVLAHLACGWALIDNGIDNGDFYYPMRHGLCHSGLGIQARAR